MKGGSEENTVPSLNQLVPDGGGEVGLSNPGQSKDTAPAVGAGVSRFSARVTNSPLHS